MKFTKMHGIGNDFIVVDCMHQPEDMDLGKMAELVCNRHFGIGADGLMLILPSSVADFKMNLYNSDGSFAEMCGNGIRCFAKYVYDHGMTNMPNISVETPAGIKYIEMMVKDGKMLFATVDMGIPTLLSNGANLLLDGKAPERSLITEPIVASGREMTMAFLDTGVPHSVIFTELTGFPFYILGPELEKHPRFPAKANIDFTEIVSRNNINVRVWERGAGETMACGTGACAAATAAYYLGFTDATVDVKLPGGTLNITIEEDGHLKMRGPATESFTGEIVF